MTKRHISKKRKTRKNKSKLGNNKKQISRRKVGSGPKFDLNKYKVIYPNDYKKFLNSSFQEKLKEINHLCKRDKNKLRFYVEKIFDEKINIRQKTELITQIGNCFFQDNKDYSPLVTVTMSLINNNLKLMGAPKIS